MDLGTRKYRIENFHFEIEDPPEHIVNRLKGNPRVEIIKEEQLDYTDVSGIGPAYAEDLREAYESPYEVIEAGAEDVARGIDGISEEKAEELVDYVTDHGA